DADFADVFEVRGTERERRGTRFEPKQTEHGLTFAYLGLDHVRRETVILCEPAPSRVSRHHLSFDLKIPMQGETAIMMCIHCRNTSTQPTVISFHSASETLVRRSEELQAHTWRIETSNGQFNRWVQRSRADL